MGLFLLLGPLIGLLTFYALQVYVTGTSGLSFRIIVPLVTTYPFAFIAGVVPAYLTYLVHNQVALPPFPRALVCCVAGFFSTMILWPLAGWSVGLGILGAVPGFVCSLLVSIRERHL